MALKQEDFSLSEEELRAINQYFATQARAVAQAGEHIFMPSRNVHFSFTPVLGRSVQVTYDSEVTPHEISSEWTDPS